MAIYPKMNLAQLRLAARQRADMVNSQFVSEEELNSYINASYFELYDLLVQKYGNDYYVTQYSFSLQQNQERYDLPADFFKLLGVDLQIGGGPDGYVSLRPFTMAERNRYSTANVQTWIGVTNLRYRISGGKLWFTPSPQTGQQIHIWYVPRLAELVDTTTLTVAAQPVDGDVITIGATTLGGSPTLTVTAPVSGDFVSIAAPTLGPTPIDFQANEVTLTVSAPTAGSTITIGGTVLTEGVEWSIGGTDALTAQSISDAINLAAISGGGISATASSNVVSLLQASSATLSLSTSNIATLIFNASKIALTWMTGATNADSAANLAAAITGQGIGIIASNANNVISFINSVGLATTAAGNYSVPIVGGATTRLAWSSASLTSGWPLGATTAQTASNIAAAINEAGIDDVSAVANGSVITLTQAATEDLAVSASNTLGTDGATTRLQFSSSVLTNGSLVADGISGWLEYVICDAAIKMMQKEESDTSVLQLQKQALIKRIEAAAENRDAGNPATIADVQWTNGTWPFGNGFGGGGGIP